VRAINKPKERDNCQSASDLDVASFDALVLPARTPSQRWQTIGMR